MRPQPRGATGSAAPGVSAADGFILAATLWALVALSIVAVYVNGVTHTNIDNAHRNKLMLQAELDRRSTEATVLYLLATNRMGHASLLLEDEQRFAQYDEILDHDADGELSLAGERYAGLGDTGFSIQDENGLISVNMPTDPLFGLMMKSVGVSEKDLARLRPLVVDYIDMDDSRSLDGAEKQSYIDAGMPPPPNWFLSTPMELNHVFGAADLLDSEQWRQLRDMATPRLLVSVNFNTMPAAVATVALGVEQEALDAFFAARTERSIGTLEHVHELTRASPPVDPGFIAVAPSQYLRITTWWRGGGPRTVLGITLTPVSLMGPWRTEYRYSEPVDHAAPLSETPTVLLGGHPPVPGRPPASA